MTNTPLIILGGAGYLGRAFVKAAKERKCDLQIFDRQAGMFAPGLPIKPIDIRDPESVLAAIVPGATVINFAGIADLNAAKNLPREVIETNVVGNINVLEACREKGVRKYCFASTAYVYSLHGSFYRISKRTSEEYILEYQKRYGVDFLILRYGSLYGGDSNTTNGMHRIVETALREGVLRYGGEPTDSREFIHVDDASDISLDLVLGDARNEAFMLTGAERITMQQLFELMSEILDRPIKMEFSGSDSAGHYRQTQYNYAPIEARKVFSTRHVDIGNGLMRLIERMHLSSSTIEQDALNALDVIHE